MRTHLAAIIDLLSPAMRKSFNEASVVIEYSLYAFLQQPFSRHASDVGICVHHECRKATRSSSAVVRKTFLAIVAAQDAFELDHWDCGMSLSCVGISEYQHGCKRIPDGRLRLLPCIQEESLLLALKCDGAARCLICLAF